MPHPTLIPWLADLIRPSSMPSEVVVTDSKYRSAYSPPADNASPRQRSIRRSDKPSFSMK